MLFDAASGTYAEGKDFNASCREGNVWQYDQSPWECKGKAHFLKIFIY